MSYLDLNSFLSHWELSITEIEEALPKGFHGVIYLSGSPVQEHATLASDLDLYVIRTADTGSLGIEFSSEKLAKVLIDTSEVEEKWLLALIDGFAHVTPTDPVPRLPPETTPVVAYETLCRLLHSIPLNEKERYWQLRSSVDRRKIVSWRQHICAEASEKAIRDALALEALGEMDAAHWVYIDLIQHVVELIVLSGDVLVDRRKWLSWALTKSEVQEPRLNALLKEIFSGGIPLGRELAAKVVALARELQARVRSSPAPRSSASMR